MDTGDTPFSTQNGTQAQYLWDAKDVMPVSNGFHDLLTDPL